jgi:hypothetical protein
MNIKPMLLRVVIRLVAVNLFLLQAAARALARCHAPLVPRSTPKPPTEPVLPAFLIPSSGKYEETAPSLEQLPLSQAICVVSAAYWLKLGQADQALRELQPLTPESRRHPLVIKMQIRVLQASNLPGCCEAPPERRSEFC